MPTVYVELVGTLRHHIGKRSLNVSLPEHAMIVSLVKDLEENHGAPGGLLADCDRGVVRLKVLVLVNGIEISVLNGVKTSLKDGDSVTFVPVSHGG